MTIPLQRSFQKTYILHIEPIINLCIYENLQCRNWYKTVYAHDTDYWYQWVSVNNSDDPSYDWKCVTTF